MNMVERVAEVLYNKSWNTDVKFKNCYSCTRKLYFEMARAAIEAMREPTDNMPNEFYKMKLAEGHTKYSAVFQYADWERAIDAALKE
jgi:hypothetical protein